MTQKDKAEELVKKFMLSLYGDIQPDLSHSKQCAIIAVEELISSTHTCRWHQDVDWDEVAEEFTQDYWIEVKTEIEKL